MSESLPPTEDLGVTPMPSKEEHMALLAGLKAPPDLGPVEGANPDLGPVEPVAPPAADLTPTEPVSFTAYKAARGPAPEAATKALQLAKDRGVSPQFAADNLDALQQQDEQDKLATALAGMPITHEFMSRSGLPSAYKDDVTVLQALEMGLADVGYGISARSYMDNPQAADESNLAAYEQAAADYAARKPGFVAEVARAIPNVAAYGAASVLGSALGGPQGGPALGMGTALYQLNRGVLYRRILEQAPIKTADERAMDASLEGKDTSDEQYAAWAKERQEFEALAKGYAKKGALTGAVIGAVLGDSFTRALPLANRALANIGQEIAAKAATETLAKAALQRGTELVGHTLSGALLMSEQAVVDNATVQKATTGQIDYGKAAEAGKDAFTEGLGVAAVLSAYTPWREFLRDVGRLREAPQDVARLDDLVDQAKASKLIQRAPAEAEQLLGQMAAQGDAHTVYVDAEAAQKPEVAAKLVEALADEGRALAEAQATGADVPVPTEKYLTTLADQHDMLREDVKLNPEGATLRQAQEILNGPVSKLLAERTVLDQQPDSPEKRTALQDLHERMRDTIASQYRADPQEYAKAFTDNAQKLLGAALSQEPKPVEAPPPADVAAWALKLTDERTISELQPGRYELAARRAEDKLAAIATQSAEKGQEAARQGFLGAGMQAQEGAAGEAGVANLRQAGTKADTAAKKLAQVPQLERARDLARAQATVQTEVKAEMDKGREYLAKRDTDRYRADLAKAAPEYLDFFNTVQEAVDDNTPRATPNPQALDALLLRMDHDAEPVGNWAEALRPILENPQGWNKLTPPEARSVVDAIKNIRGAARRQNEITLADRKATLREMVGEARSYLDSTNRPDSGPPAPSRASEGFGERFAKGAEAIHTELLQPLRILRDRLGALGNYIADAYVKARNGKEELARQVGDEVSRFYEKLPKELKATRFDGVDGPGSPVFSDKWTRQDLWEFASWWGSESGADRLKKGLRITDAQAHEFMSQLTGAEADFLEAKWKLNDEKLWPLVRDHERALMGAAPAKIEARPFTIRTAEGDVRELRGGYEPARYRTDAESTAKAPEDAQSISEYWGTLRDGFESTAKYFTKERAQNVARVPDLNWSMYSGHVNSVLHYLAFDEFVRNTGRIFRDPEFRELVQRRLGVQDMKELDKFLGVAARGRVESAQDGAGELGRIVGGGFRSRVGTAAFQLNPRIIAGQLSHFAAAIPALKLGPADILYGLSQAFRPGTWGEAFDGSEQLPYRWNGFGQKMREQLVGIGPGDKPLTRKWLDAAGWSGYHAMDGFLSKAIFEAASSKAERAGADPVASRQAGDRAVELMMPPLNLAEQSSFARDRGVIGSLILVRNFPNTLYNIGAKLEWDARNQVMASDPGWQRAATALGAYGAAGASYLGTVWAAHILGRFLMGHGRQPDETSKEWLEREALSAPFYPVPFAGEAASVLAESAVTHKTLKSIVTTRGVIAQAPALAEVERAIRDLGTAINAGTGTEDRVFAGLRLAANVLNVPSEPLRGVQYGYDLWSGRARPRGAFDVAGGFAYGKRRKQAKNPATLTQDFLSGD